MGWLAGENGFWLFLAAVAGSLVTLFLTLRRATVSRPVGRDAAPEAAPDADADEPDPDEPEPDGPDPDEPPMPSRRSFEPPSYEVPKIGYEAPAHEEPGRPYGAGSAEPLEGGASPGEEFTVKGNASSMLFHSTDSPYYARTIADVWFDSEDAARAAGFTSWDDS